MNQSRTVRVARLYCEHDLTRQGHADAHGAEPITWGIVGDISSRFFDAQGRAVALPIDDRVMALTLEQHQAIPVRIAVAGGEAKREAVIGGQRP